ncbi:MAG: hypothetical protein ACRD3E_12865 [Terriglobales bacterium]
MSRSSEARFWQAIGAVSALVGGLILAYDFERYGLASIEPKALAIGAAASFILLAAGACYIAGRALHVGETVLTAREASLWKALAAVCLIAGSAVIVIAWRQHGLLLDRVTMGLAGAFSIMFGLLCLTGQRVMSHMHDALVGNKSGAAKSAGA